MDFVIQSLKFLTAIVGLLSAIAGAIPVAQRCYIWLKEKSRKR